MCGGQNVPRTDEDSCTDGVAFLGRRFGIRCDSAHPAKWDLGRIGDRTQGRADRSARARWPSGLSGWTRLAEEGTVLYMSVLQDSLNIAFSQADTGRAAGSATAVWAASESRERRILFSDVEVTHKDEILLGLGRCGWRFALGLRSRLGRSFKGRQHRP